MKKKGFVTGRNLPDLAKIFAEIMPTEQGEEAIVGVIGEPGVGKSYITWKLSQDLLETKEQETSYLCVKTQSLERESMHDLVLWSIFKDKEHEIRQYDEASLRFVDQVYNDFVTQAHLNHPMPERELSGITFVEHPTQDTEENAALIMRLHFSPFQKKVINALKQYVEKNDFHINIQKQQLIKATLSGCEIELETTQENIAQKVEAFCSDQRHQEQILFVQRTLDSIAQTIENQDILDALTAD